ncbi:hypothetical protein [Nocardiopsis ansamitocini]|uniref:Uncharacterized protein n=1 Tax=Nocardiopsis ansamitocini TaxID=1670832 RepID=A0A9W6P596_9ACTN|nr:hypothetical protein [Nocardiopsis ansamitocini]GLU47620.1 hypothetical protein Nans01_19710 [Nocardiopsis ansamitocini]
MSADLDRLDTDELRRRAVALARERWDATYLWELVQSIPAAEAATGRQEAGETGALKASNLFSELIAEREGDHELREALRPVYLDYLERHEGSRENPRDSPSA